MSEEPKYKIIHNVIIFLNSAELGTRQLFSLATTTTRQRNRASRTSQGPEKIRKIVRPQCLDGVATTNIVKWQLPTTLCPENMVTLSRKNCRVPSSGSRPFFGRSRSFLVRAGAAPLETAPKGWPWIQSQLQLQLKPNYFA